MLDGRTGERVPKGHNSRKSGGGGVIWRFRLFAGCGGFFVVSRVAKEDKIPSRSWAVI